MAVYKNNNKVVSYIIVLISLFILVLITKDNVALLQENKDLKEVYNNKISEKKAELQELNEIKNKLKTDSQDLDKYSVEIKENEIIDYIYGYVEKANSNSGITIIKNITISKPQNTEIGFKESIINLTLNISSETKLKNMLKFLVSDESKYKFFIEDFSYPYNNFEDNFSVTIPLKILYK